MCVYFEQAQKNKRSFPRPHRPFRHDKSWKYMKNNVKWISSFRQCECTRLIACNCEIISSYKSSQCAMNNNLEVATKKKVPRDAAIYDLLHTSRGKAAFV